MYPNPSSKLAHGSAHIVLFEFLGRILGKALYEGITIQPQFAHLFLSFLKGDHVSCSTCAPAFVDLSYEMVSSRFVLHCFCKL